MNAFDRRIQVLSTTIVSLSVVLLILFLFVVAQPPVQAALAPPDSAIDHQALVDSYKEQLNLLKTVGGIMVTGLASAVGFLIRSLLANNNVLVNEVKLGAQARFDDSKVRNEAHTELKSALDNLTEAVREFGLRCPYTKEAKVAS